MAFFNREQDINRMKSILSGEPNLVYFVYGPINSGKTALLIKVFEELPENYRFFYINFRARDVEDIKDLLKVLFSVKKGPGKLSEFLKEILKGGAKSVEKISGIPIPERIFDLLFNRVDKVEDVFAFLENYFEEIVKKDIVPVFVLDEMQTIKEVLNTTGRPVIGRLFNFLIRLTKETHLCHCLCATSDCLFIEDVYSNARLEGRAEYILVDDLDREHALVMYEKFGFKEKDFIFEYLGGKIGDIIRLFEKKKQGYIEREGIERMIKDETSKLEYFLEKVEFGEKYLLFEDKKIFIGIEGIKETLKVFKENEEISKKEISPIYRNYLISENIIFYNPLEGIVRPQGRILWHALRRLTGNLSHFTGHQ